MNEKVVLITGGSSGIGRALALHFAQQGYRVAITGRNLDSLNMVAGEIEAKKGVALCIQADASKKEDAEKSISETIHSFGRLDVLINNAGISMRALFQDVKLEVIEEVMQINFWGMVYTTHFAMPYLLKSKGTIVGISSIAGFRGLPCRTGYSASKFAMQGFLESLRTELLESGVNVLTACPGFTASNIRNVARTADGSIQGESPLNEGKIMQPDVVAAHIFEAVRKRKRSIVLGMQGKLTVFLNKWFPGLMDRIVLNHFKKEAGNPWDSKPK